MTEFLVWFFTNLGLAVYNFGYALTHPASWLNWSDPQALMRFIYYGASVELFFVFFVLFLIVTAVGLWRRQFMWSCVRLIEAIGNGIGRFFAWAGLIMVVQQVLVVFLQRIFRVSEISFGPFAPFGYKFWDHLTLVRFDLSWWGEELKLYNAMVVCMCCAYTFIQGGHVRVDLIYAGVTRARKKFIDMFGCLFFMLPSLVLIWLYTWFFLWRSLVTPKVSASDKLELLLNKARILKWNVETIGFSPNGFNGYFLFKVLMLAFVALMILQAIGFFYRSLMEWRDGEAAEGRYLDRDTLGAGEEIYEGTH